MKYIRTKHGISELCDGEHIGGFVAVKCPLQIKGYRVVSKESIIKQADNIEELCDEFIAMCDEYGKPFAWSNHHKDYFKEVKQFYDFWGKKEHKHLQFLYGAIWTDKGLIYVAKMNEKGELELL